MLPSSTEAFKSIAESTCRMLDSDGGEQPWLTVCPFLNPHELAMFGVIALARV